VSVRHQVGVVDDDVVFVARLVGHAGHEGAERGGESHGLHLDVPDHVLLKLLAELVLEVLRESQLVDPVGVVPVGGRGAVDLQELVLLGNLELQWEVSSPNQS
jgi:hypothetical protein